MPITEKLTETYGGENIMPDRTEKDNRDLIGFWDKAFALSEEQRAEAKKQGAEDWRELAPSEKLFRAACFLGQKKKVLDFGCGDAWASIIAAKSGCEDVTAVDAAPGAVRAARFYTEVYGVEERVHAVRGAAGWLAGVPSGTFDGMICSNVLDVIPPETAETILRESARILTRDAVVMIGLNYFLSPEAADARGMELTEGNRLYINGILRLVSRTDEEWTRIFSPWYTVERLEHFAWPGEAEETRRLFRLRRREDHFLSKQKPMR